MVLFLLHRPPPQLNYVCNVKSMHSPLWCWSRRLRLRQVHRPFHPLRGLRLLAAEYFILIDPRRIKPPSGVCDAERRGSHYIDTGANL